MSWFITVVPLHTVAADPDGWAWLQSNPDTLGVPADPPPPLALPTVRDVLAALERAGLHGEPWYRVVDDADGPSLPPCPRGDACDRTMDLGEVLIRGGGIEGLSLETTVDHVSFRKPGMPAGVRGALAFAEVAGPVMAMHDSSGAVIVLHPADDPAAVEAVWP